MFAVRYCVLTKLDVIESLQGGFYVYYKKKGALATDKEILKQAVTTSLRSAGAELEQPLGALRRSKKVKTRIIF